MRIILAVVLVLLSLSLVWASNGNIEKRAGNRRISMVQKGIAYYSRGHFRAAVKYLEPYVKDNPDPKIYYLIGYSYYKMREMKKAMEYFNDAYLIDPDYAPSKRK